MAQPRAVGEATLSVRADETGDTRIMNLRQSGSSKLIFPRTHRADVEAVLVNTAGGVTGGDRFEVDIHVHQNAALTLTTQAAERAYRAQEHETAQIRTKLRVENGARLHWLPQELILFDRCALRRRLCVDLDPQAELLLVEPVVFGRRAMCETLTNVFFQDRITINRAGCPIYVDGVNLNGDAAAHLARAATANGAGAMASVIMVTPLAERHLQTIRALLPPTAGASLLASDILTIRMLAPDSFELRRSLLPLLDHLSQNTLPNVWRL